MSSNDESADDKNDFTNKFDSTLLKTFIKTPNAINSLINKYAWFNQDKSVIYCFYKYCY